MKLAKDMIQVKFVAKLWLFYYILASGILVWLMFSREEDPENYNVDCTDTFNLVYTIYYVFAGLGVLSKLLLMMVARYPGTARHNLKIWRRATTPIFAFGFLLALAALIYSTVAE